ncbi:MAG: hypothetical protein ACRD1B_07640, partial [Thermoanaerobaculia bacterium]
MRVGLLSIIASMLCLAGVSTLLGPAMAQDIPDVEGVCVSNCDVPSDDGYGGGDGIVEPGWLNEPFTGPSAEQQAWELNHQAVALDFAGNYSEAVELYRRALAFNPYDPIIRGNLAGALLKLSGQQRDAGGFDLAEQAALEGKGLLNGYEVLEGSQYTVAELTASADWLLDTIARERREQSAKSDLQARVSTAAAAIGEQLAAEQAGTASSALTGLAFGDPNVVDLRDDPTVPILNTDPNVVDLRDNAEPGAVRSSGAVAKNTDPKAAAIIASMTAVANKQGWSADELARLDNALNSLGADGIKATKEDIRETWGDIQNRGRSGELAQNAAAGAGPGLYGSGTQSFQDCAIFALATAAGLPYGVAATHAAELIGQAEWRQAEERENPQATLEKVGLNGGEVIMLAEAFGQAEVIDSSDFAKTLTEGRPVLINVIPKGGTGGHE